MKARQGQVQGQRDAEAVEEPVVQAGAPEQVGQEAAHIETPQQREEVPGHIEESVQVEVPEQVEELGQSEHPVNVRILLLINNTISIADAYIPITPSTLGATINNVAVQYGVPTGEAVIYVTRGSEVAGVRVSGGEVIIMREVSWVGGLDGLGVVGGDEAVLVVVRVRDEPVHSQAPSVADVHSQAAPSVAGSVHHPQAGAAPSVASVHSQRAPSVVGAAPSRPASPGAVSVHSQLRVPSRTSHHSSAVPEGPVIHAPSGAVSRAPYVHEASRAVSRVPSVVNV